MSSNGWKVCKLGELIISANTGLDAIKRAPIVKNDTGIKCIRIQDISQSKEFNDWGFCDVNNKNFENFKLKKNDILIARTGETVGVNKLIKDDLKSVYNNGLIRIVIDKKQAIPQFIYYTLQGKKFESHIDAVARGSSTQPNLRIESLLEFNISLPDLSKQIEIASLLSSIDEKIELNLQTNQTLEAIAHAIFKEWFMNFNGHSAFGERNNNQADAIQKGWRTTKLNDIIELNPKIPLKKGIVAKYIEMKDLSENSAGIKRYIDREFNSGSKFQNGDTLLARITPCLENGKTGFVDFLNTDEAGWGSTEFIVLRGKMGISPYYVYCLSRYQAFRDFAIQSMVGSSGRQRVVESILLDYDVVLPEKENMDKFHTTVQPIFEQIKSIELQSKTLVEIRDSILPKLMNGEIEL